SYMLSDRLGNDPGWDPLQFAINEAHDQGMELHAWINTFPAWRADRAMPPETTPLHPYLAHPEWLVCDSAGNPMQTEQGYITFSPGIPAVRRHVQNVTLDIVQNYDVDGIHFDYIRYPEGSNNHGYSGDSVSVHRFRSRTDNGLNLSWKSWQREQVSRFVADVYNAVTEVKPWVKVSSAVLGHHHGGAWNGYHSVYQDARRWLAMGKMDIIYTMTYTRMDHPTAPYTEAIAQWRQMFHLGRPIVAGIATYKLGRSYEWQEIKKQVEYVREKGFAGMVFFSANSLLRKLDDLSSDYYPSAALTAPMPWKENVPVVEPNHLVVQSRADSLRFSWQMDDPASNFVLYRHQDIDNPRHIVAILPGGARSYALPAGDGQQTYYLTAINRTGMESKAVSFEEEKAVAVKE
ncbi:MAG: family 10 glycosylhydrolase, partial [Caldithrix sp.]|nr:family 10 glycosylhydrolase [Caldithrix sp.]